MLNELMYHPPGTNDALEFVELHNLLGTSVPLHDPANPNNTWRLRKGIDFDFPTNLSIPAGGFLVIVGFDPQWDPVALATFQAAYGSGMTLVGPYSGKLDHNGELLELQKPDAPQTAPGPDFGFVPHVVMDRLDYRDVSPWALSPDGLGDSLKRIDASRYGNDPVNWTGGMPTPGAANFTGGIAPRIVSFGVSPTKIVTIQWQSQPAKNYRVRSSPDLINWTMLGSDITASSLVTSATDNVGTHQRRFYRVLLVD